VSERAGVSLRSVFQHFEDLETLLAAAADRQFERLAALASRIPRELPFEERLRLLVEERARLFEALTPVRRSALLWEPFSPEIARRLKWSRDTNRAEIERVFSAELGLLGKRERAEVTAALHTATEWPAWETLRTHNSLLTEDASRVMSRTIRALLGKEST
jgi:AcrR family transcriptional regulator